MKANNIIELIGNTPIVKLNKLITPDMADIYLKLEYFNPGGSIKDRAALGMIENAEKEGKLKEGFVIVEPTSGNTGVGLAMVGAIKGYKVILVMPDNMSIERRMLAKAHGAEIVLTPSNLGMQGAIDEAQRIVKNNNNYFMPMQFENEANPMIHSKTTAIEILNQIGTRLDYFVSAVGTGGTITGTGRVLKEKLPDIKIAAVEPLNSPVLSGGKKGSHKIQGIGAGFIPKIMDLSIVDEIIKVSDEDAFETARNLASKEGILSGISSGAAVFASIEIAKRIGKGKVVLAIIPDTGERYLSTEVYR